MFVINSSTAERARMATKQWVCGSLAVGTGGEVVAGTSWFRGVEKVRGDFNRDQPK